MDDCRYVFAPGRSSAQDACLGAMRMDDVRAQLPEGRAKLLEGYEVRKRPDRADQLGQNHNLQAAPGCAVEEVALRAFGRSGNECDIVVIMVMQVLDGQQRVFLRATQDQPGDDVD